mmetsp:Transcript_29304/g.33654  ORF Transcript_29304/g.33654 Transcript_29304/m.33654 type:complete len:975 (+) Transcript_29304:140-3064(+)
MPALYIFNRRTMFAGDDLQPTSIITSFARLAQFCILLLPVFIHMNHEARYILNSNKNAKDEEEYKLSNLAHYLFGNGGNLYNDEVCDSKAHYFPVLLYLFLSLTTLHILSSIVVEYLLYKLSSIGSPTQPELRTPLLVKIVEKKWVWLTIISNAVLLAFGIAAITQAPLYFNCRDAIDEEGNINDGGLYGDVISVWFGRTAWWIALILLLTSQSVELFVSIVTLTSLLKTKKDNGIHEEVFHDALDDLEEMNTIHGARYSSHYHELDEEMWDDRCRSFCNCVAISTCFVFGGRELREGIVGDYGQISRALADYFEDGGVLDLVASDLAAGFMMLQRQQMQKVLATRKRIHEDIQGGLRNVEDFGNIPALRQGSFGSSSIVSLDTHDFGHEEDDRRVKSIFDSATREKENSPAGDNYSLSQYQGQTAASVGINNISMSTLDPMPFSRTLLIPDGPTISGNFESSDFLNMPTAAWTLKKIPEDERNHLLWYEAQQRRVFNRNDAVDTNVIAEGARFARHSLAIYSWVLYVYMNPVLGIPNLIYSRFAEFMHECGRDSKGHADSNQNTSSQHENSNFTSNSSDSFFCNVAHGNTIGDNWFHAHRNALLAHSGLDESDLIYANFNNKYNQMPYSIIIDHKWQSVILAIRGTLSLEDCLVDVLVHPDPLDELGRMYGFDGEGQYCHSGVLSCVKYILNDLERHGILDSLLTGVGAPYSHYALRITGHSLGGGCSVLLGYCMRQRFPNLRVIPISPPGGLMSWRLATECKDFVTSFVLDSDLVPRLSIQTMEQLRDEILEMIARIKVPKIQVVKTFVVKGVLGRNKETTNPEDLAYENSQLLHSKENIPQNSKFYEQMEKFKAIQQERKEKRGGYTNIKLFPPGKMVHLVKTGERRSVFQSVAKCMTCCTTNVGYEYTPVWVDNDDFNEIQVSPTMGFDHFPNRVCLEIERVAIAFGIDTSPGSSQQDREENETLRGTLF